MQVLTPSFEEILDTPLKIEIIAIPESRTPGYPEDPLERLLDRYGITGAAVNAAQLEEAPDDREFVEVVCRFRRPMQGQ
jgi:hypothetical protein